MTDFFKVPSSAMPFLQGLIITNHVKSPLVSMAIGRVLSQYAVLPQKALGDYGAYFGDTSAEMTAEFLDAIHSIAPIDFRKATEYATKFFLIRCENAFGCCQPSCTGTNGVYNLFHVGTQFSNEELGMLKTEGQKFAGFVAGFEAIFKEMNKSFVQE